MDDLEQSELFRHDGEEMLKKRSREDHEIFIRVLKIRREYMVVVTKGTLSLEVFGSKKKSDAVSEWVKWS